LMPSVMAAATTPAIAGAVTAKAGRTRPRALARVEIFTLARIIHRAARANCLSISPFPPPTLPKP
jgi:hypothetical protein